MANERNTRGEQPWHAWLPTLVLRFLVFAALVFVLFEVTTGLGDQELGSSRAWVTVAGMVCLLLLLAVDRLIGLRVGPRGMEATLAQVQVQALEEVDALENREAAEAARAQILQAADPAQVEAARAMAVELNVSRVTERVHDALRQKRKLYVRYRAHPHEPTETYLCAPLDIKPGTTPATRANDYLWVHSYRHGHVLSLRLGRVLGVELSEEIFAPRELMVGWKQTPEWNIPREW